jgi:hypothetical protein
MIRLAILPGEGTAPHPPSGGMLGELAWIIVLLIAALVLVALIFPRRPHRIREHDLPEPDEWIDDARAEDIERRGREGL